MIGLGSLQKNQMRSKNQFGLRISLQKAKDFIKTVEVANLKIIIQTKKSQCYWR